MPQIKEMPLFRGGGGVTSVERGSRDLTYDREPSYNQDLTFDFADQYFAGLNIKFGDMQKRVLWVTDTNGRYTNAALMLSDQCEHTIKCAVYEDSKAHFKARNEFTGSILKQLDDAYAYLELNNGTNTGFKGLRRVDSPAYPVVALREALVNAAAHRDYTYPSSIMINIFTSHIEIVSPGGLARDLTMDDVMQGLSLSRNNKLAHIFYHLELIEGFGTGISRIKDSYGDFSVNPVFTPAPASFLVILPNTLVSTADTALPPVQEKIDITPQTVNRKEVKPEPPAEAPPIAARNNTKCYICGYTLRSKELICHFCLRNDDLIFRIVKKYVEQNPENSIYQVSINTGVPTKKLIAFLREERFEIQKAELDDTLMCLRCRTPIRTGKMCDGCKKSFSGAALQVKLDRYARDDDKNDSAKPGIAVKNVKFHSRNSPDRRTPATPPSAQKNDVRR